MAMYLSHHMDLTWLAMAHARTRKDGAAGVDGVTGEDYEVDLTVNLQNLLDRAKSGTYRAPSVRRVHIPKGNGTQTRPLGIPTFEDKILQRAVAMALEPVYEQDFLPCSYGFRPGRSAHQAVETLREGLRTMGGGFVIDLDIRSYFDTVDKGQLQRLLAQRVRDGVIRRRVGKWLNAGVLEEGRTTYPGRGVPQGGVISPLLSNLYLHEVLDTWFHERVIPCMRGRAFIVRYADDAVLAFSDKTDAERVFRTLPKRFAKYGLTLHPDKTEAFDHREEDVENTDDAEPARHESVAHEGASHAHHLPTQNAVAQAPRSLSILWDHGQLAGLVGLLGGDQAVVGEIVG